MAGAGQTVLTGETIPAPIKGWDASSPLANMDPAAAIVLDNWFPEPAFVRLRAGHEEHAQLATEGNDEFTKVYLPMDVVGTTFADVNAGGSAHTWTASADAQISAATFKFGLASGLFDGTGDFVSTPDHADFTLGSGDFTVDFWFNRGGGDGTVRFACGSSDNASNNTTKSFAFALIPTNVMVFEVYQGGASVTVTGTTAFTATGWHHCAGVRTGDILKLFLDGVQEGGDIAVTGAVNDSANALSVGCMGEFASLFWFGSLDDFRLSVGVARWTTTFSVPTAEYGPVGTLGPCESLMAYHGPTGTTKLFAARGTRIYDATGTGDVAAVVVGLTNARWQHCHQTSSGGNFLVICNGADAPRNFNGTAWSTPSITGVTATSAIHVNVHKRRLWFTEINTTKAFYLPVDSIAGAAVEFDFGPLMSKGGYLMATATWTHDGGWGEDDFFVAISSKGQVMIYAGNDPSSADDWFLKGVFEIGAPIGRRCFSKVGGDLAVITVDGVVPLSQAILMDRAVTRRVAITGRISRAMNEAARDAKDNFGGQLQTYPLGTAVLLNVPITEGSQIHQYVMNPLTGAWCRYTGMNGTCWEIYLERIFFGGIDGNVYEADVTGRDNGEIIVADLKTAFNYFNSRGVNKQYRVMRALLSGDGQVIPTMTLNTDYRNTPAPVTVASSYEASGAQWGAFNWGDGTLWAGSADLINLADWVNVENEGHCAAVRCRVAAANENEEAVIDLRLQAFDILFEKGGFV